MNETEVPTTHICKECIPEEKAAYERNHATNLSWMIGCKNTDAYYHWARDKICPCNVKSPAALYPPALIDWFVGLDVPKQQLGNEGNRSAVLRINFDYLSFFLYAHDIFAFASIKMRLLQLEIKPTTESPAVECHSHRAIIAVPPSTALQFVDKKKTQQ